MDHFQLCMIIFSLRIGSPDALDDICSFGANTEKYADNATWSLNGRWTYYGIPSYHDKPVWRQEHQDFYMDWLENPVYRRYWVRDDVDIYSWCVEDNTSYPVNCYNNWYMYNFKVNAFFLDQDFSVKNCSYFTVKNDYKLVYYM